MFKKNYIDTVQKDKHYLTMQITHWQETIRHEPSTQDEFFLAFPCASCGHLPAVLVSLSGMVETPRL
jgi:hypothetical protein